MTLKEFVGTHFSDHRIDEAFTVFGVEEIDGKPIYVDVQYDDGTPHDEAIADESIADQLGWDSDGRKCNITLGKRNSSLILVECRG